MVRTGCAALRWNTFQQEQNMDVPQITDIFAHPDIPTNELGPELLTVHRLKMER
jgi:hypothetical protein